MNSEDSNMAANAICHAADMVKHEYFYMLGQHSRPSTLYKPAIYPDGNMWCALLGENLQRGVAGFGETPAKAFDDFDKNFNSQTLPIKD